jgi:hypothetical protein
MLLQQYCSLRIAYGQYDDAQNMMDDHVYDTAVNISGLQNRMQYHSGKY